MESGNRKRFESSGGRGGGVEWKYSGNTAERISGMGNINVMLMVGTLI